ncbi:carbohydrate ABC transporter permease [Plastoroseomonas hellenica]|uniref:Sugar ABC transporter permease n=1 Tax=Plastoroseomonas hellenica TaxID=2687306 RepID=A0ABS5EYG7_9PROT|nr:sugar ABC transporter permease [Plastoroseomonas hellenica]MBR0644813.1 sugar ABC transporter permease [Plastoroseomonas hellenica]MBR0665329.1 sugar ABC transporter permease [Plastoroseomonas hellenica]
MPADTLTAGRTPATHAPGSGSLQRFARRRSTIAFLMTLPLLAVIVGLVAYPAGYGIYLSTLNRTMVRNIGFGNYEILFDTDTFWSVAWQSCIFAITAVLLKALIGFWLAHMLHHIPAKGQRKWRGMLLVPWVIPPALSTLGWWWMFDPTYSSINYVLSIFAVPAVPWLGEPIWARIAVIMVNVWYGAPFFMIMYLAAIKSVPEQLYEAAAIDGANGWQRLRYVTLPMMANIISITVLFSLIVTFANYDIVRVLTNGGPRDLTHVFASYAFQVGILSGNIPRGAAVSLFMLPILAVCAFFVLRGVTRRNKEQM